MTTASEILATDNRTPGDFWLITLGAGESLAGGRAWKTIIIAVMTATGDDAYTPGVVYPMPDNVSEVATRAGARSPLRRAVQAWAKTAPSEPALLLPVAATSGGSAATATGTETIAMSGGNPTASGVAKVTSCGEVFQVNYTTSDTPTTLAAAIVAAHNARSWLPMVLSNSAGVITKTAGWAGRSGGNADQETLPFSVEFTPGTGVATTSVPVGATVAGAEGSTTEAANLTAALAALSGEDAVHHVLAMPADEQTDDVFDAFLLHLQNSREPAADRHCVGFANCRLSVSDARTLAQAMNDPFLTLSTGGTGEQDDAVFAAVAHAGAIIRQINRDATANTIDEKIQALAGAPVGSRLSSDDIKEGIADGVTLRKTTDAGVSLVRLVSTKSKTGGSDDYRAAPLIKAYGAIYLKRILQARYRVQWGKKNLVRNPVLADGSIDIEKKLHPKQVAPYVIEGWLRTQIRKIADETGHLTNVEAQLALTTVSSHPTTSSAVVASIPIEIVDELAQALFEIREVSAG